MEMHDRMMGTMSGAIPSPSVDRPPDNTTDDPVNLASQMGAEFLAPIVKS
jgi:hypothetical protein